MHRIDYTFLKYIKVKEKKLKKLLNSVKNGLKYLWELIVKVVKHLWPRIKKLVKMLANTTVKITQYLWPKIKKVAKTAWVNVVKITKLIGAKIKLEFIKIIQRLRKITAKRKYNNNNGPAKK